jgi:hypothetical protein
MGGYGSGRRSSRPTTDDCLRISLSYLKGLGMLKRHCFSRRERNWSNDGQAIARLTIVTDIECREPSPCLKITGRAFGRDIDCILWLDCMPTPFGGERWYALCPRTGRRCTALVLPPGQTHFASVKGWKVAYGSQRECPIHRAHRAIEKAKARRKALSKYARKPTRERLLDREIKRWVFVEEEIDKIAQMMYRYDARIHARTSAGPPKG